MSKHPIDLIPIEQIQNLCVRLGVITVQDLNQYTAIEMIYLLAKKVNEVIDGVNKQSENIEYLLGQGLIDQILIIFDEWLSNGTFDQLINQTALKTVNDRIDRISITPEIYGAKGDGVTDDTESFKQMFTELASGCDIILGKDKTYCISDGGLNCTVDAVKIIGNNATLKLIDDSGYIEGLVYGTHNKNIINATCNHFTIEHLNFDGNIEHNYLLVNGEKYYGVHPDLHIEGIPNTFGAYNVINFIGSGLEVKNCQFTNVSGTAINTGITNRSIITKDVEIFNCLVEKCFRAGISLFHTFNSRIHHCEFKENQRHNIQFYTGCEDGEVDYNTITCDVNAIPKWYPSWGATVADSERIGVSIAHPSYSDFSQNFKIEKNVMKSTDSERKGLIYGVAIRNYPKNIEIIDNKIEVKFYPIFVNRGIIGALDVINNVLKADENCYYQMFGVGSYPPVTGSEVKSTINFIGNDLSAYRLIEFVNTQEQLANSFNRLDIIFENNILHNSRIFTGIEMTTKDTSNPVVELVYHNNPYDGNEYYLNRYIQSKTFTIKPKEMKLLTVRKEDYPNCHYLKIGKISGKKNEAIHIRGHLMSASRVDKGRYAEFMCYVRLNHTVTTNDLTAITLLDINSKNMDTGYFKVVNSERDSETNELYLYLVADNLITVTIDEIQGQCSFTFIDDQRWTSSIDVPIIREYQTN